MRPRPCAWLWPIAFLLLELSCQQASHDSRSPRARAIISVDKSTVHLGDNIEILVDGVPDGWSGIIWVNSSRHRFELASKRRILKVIRQNGFTTSAPTEIFFYLKDRDRSEIPVANSGILTVKVADP
jgi:hypothetical protein